MQEGLLGARPIKQNKNFLISPNGDVISLARKVTLSNGKTINIKSRILKPAKDNKGYLRVAFNVDGKHTTFKVHRLVAEAFLLNHDDLSDVDHKDDNKVNNFIENLQWMSKKGNTDKAIFTGRITTTPVIQMTPDGDIVKKWDSMAEAERTGLYKHSEIHRCCTGKRPHHKGFRWEYANATS